MALPVANTELRVEQGRSPICRYESMPPSRSAPDALLPKEAVLALQHAVDVRDPAPPNVQLLARHFADIACRHNSAIAVP
jgi:hypothetical protein